MLSTRQFLSSNLINRTGWRTNRKIIVFESDDWGSIRMPSRSVYQKLLDENIPVDQCPYNRFDSLATGKDMSELFNILIKYKDSRGHHPTITANTIMANPDFGKILDSGFREYAFEPFTTTLTRYPDHSDSFRIMDEGIRLGLFHPQFHGREHVNINLWLKLLQEGHPVFKKAFDLGLWGLGPAVAIHPYKINIQAAFDGIVSHELFDHHKQIEEGLFLFNNLFGFKSESFIANNFIWHPDLNITLKKFGVNIIQGMKYQLVPRLKQRNRKRIRHHTGEVNDLNQLFLVRNCEFEPALNSSVDSVGNCLKQISIAFRWRKPAIISMHRVNFIGFIQEKNRSANLKKLNSLLNIIVSKWPSVEFMTSNQLAAIIWAETIDNHQLPPVSQ